MKAGIYISGLGQTFAEESVEKYAGRLVNELSFSTTGVQYELRSEKISYTGDRLATVVSIIEKKEQSRVIYKLYDFGYHEILTQKFNSYSLLTKNFFLFFLVLRKLPLLLLRLITPASYSRPLQTLYLFMIFMVIAFAILFMLPATLALLTGFLSDANSAEILGKLGLSGVDSACIDRIEKVSGIIVSLTAFVLLILPNANVMVSTLATEFVCANDYIEHGAQRQFVQGNLEKLVDYITENEPDCKIHFHTYSFGSLLALDYVYPYGNKVTRNAMQYCEALITIGTPFEFIKSYYTEYYRKREMELGNQLCWINVYSTADALATNFRNDTRTGEAEFGIEKNSAKPINVNYEVAAMRSGITGFFMLYSIRVHGMYWDPRSEGQSCLRLVFEEMRKRGLIG